MKTGLLTMILTLAALNAAAEAPAAPMAEHDPLMRQIMSKQLTQSNGGVTGAVRIASGQTISLNIVDPPSISISTESLRDAVAEPRARRPDADRSPCRQDSQGSRPTATSPLTRAVGP